MFSGVWLIVSGLVRRVWASKVARIAVIFVVAALVLLAAHYADVRKAVNKERAACKEQAQRALVSAQERYRTEEEFHAREIQELQTKYANQQQQAAAVDARAMADLGSGVRRLRVPIASRCPAPTSVAAPTGRTDDAATAELAPEAARYLYDIAADGDEAIRQLTALQAWARDALKLCGQQGAR